jgi:hypothetical protein
MSDAFPWRPMIVGKSSALRLQRPSLFLVLRYAIRRFAVSWRC